MAASGTGREVPREIQLVQNPAGSLVLALQQLNEGGPKVSAASDQSVAHGRFTVSCRVIYPTVGKKTNVKVFMLRNLTRHHFSSLANLRNEILNQLGPTIVSEDGFDVGYMKGNTKVMIHSEDDLTEILHKLGRGEACVFWCSGEVPEERSSAKRSLSQDSFSDSDDEDQLRFAKKKKRKRPSALEEKNARIEDFIQQLKDKHKDSFTNIQYRLWAEMLDVGTHKSIAETPNAPMFNGVKHQKTTPATALTSAITDMASSLAVAFKAVDTSKQAETESSSSSPDKLVELRGKCIQQLRELHDLYVAGALSLTEYDGEKESVLHQLTIFTPGRK